MKHMYFGKFGKTPGSNIYAFVLDKPIDVRTVKINTSSAVFILPTGTQLHNLDTGSNYKSSLIQQQDRKNIRICFDMPNLTDILISRAINRYHNVTVYSASTVDLDDDDVCLDCRDDIACKNCSKLTHIEFDARLIKGKETIKEKIESSDNIEYPKLFSNLKIRKFNPKKEGPNVTDIHFEKFPKRTGGDE